MIYVQQMIQLERRILSNIVVYIADNYIADFNKVISTPNQVFTILGESLRSSL